MYKYKFSCQPPPTPAPPFSVSSKSAHRLLRGNQAFSFEFSQALELNRLKKQPGPP